MHRYAPLFFLIVPIGFLIAGYQYWSTLYPEAVKFDQDKRRGELGRRPDDLAILDPLQLNAPNYYRFRAVMFFISGTVGAIILLLSVFFSPSP